LVLEDTPSVAARVGDVPESPSNDAFHQIDDLYPDLAALTIDVGPSLTMRRVIFRNMNA